MTKETIIYDKLPPSQTDWAKVDAMTEEELEALIKADPDDIWLTEKEFAGGWREYPEGAVELRVPVSIQDAAMLKEKGLDMAALASKLLHGYVEKNLINRS